MKPYTTTVEHILPGMIVRFTSSEPDCDHGETYTFTVRYTRLPGGHRGGRLLGEGCGFEVDADTEITVLHDPTRDEQAVQMSVKQSWDDEITSAARRSAEHVMAYHMNKGPQQYKTGGVKINVTSWDQLGPAQPITMHGTPGMYVAPELTGYKEHLIVLTKRDKTGAFMYRCIPGSNTDVPEGLETAGPSLYDTRHLGWVHLFDR